MCVFKKLVGEGQKPPDLKLFIPLPFIHLTRSSSLDLVSPKSNFLRNTIICFLLEDSHCPLCYIGLLLRLGLGWGFFGSLGVLTEEFWYFWEPESQIFNGELNVGY